MIRAASSIAFRSRRGGNSLVDGVPKLGVADSGIEHDAAQLAEDLDHLVGGPCGGGAGLVQLTSGLLVGIGKAAVEQVDRLIGDVDQRLTQESELYFDIMNQYAPPTIVPTSQPIKHTPTNRAQFGSPHR